MYSDQSIFIVGPMGAGKTTIGKKLAFHLKRSFVDTDHLIVSRSGADIPWIFDIEGEQGFRRREAQICAEVTLQKGLVVATGGGIVLDPENRKVLASRGLVIYLKATVDELAQRTAKDKNRPLLKTPNPRATIESILNERGPLYEEIADIIIDTQGSNTGHTINRILSHLNKDSI